MNCLYTDLRSTCIHLIYIHFICMIPSLGHRVVDLYKSKICTYVYVYTSVLCARSKWRDFSFVATARHSLPAAIQGRAAAEGFYVHRSPLPSAATHPWIAAGSEWRTVAPELNPLARKRLRSPCWYDTVRMQPRFRGPEIIRIFAVLFRVEHGRVGHKAPLPPRALATRVMRQHILFRKKEIEKQQRVNVCIVHL